MFYSAFFFPTRPFNPHFKPVFANKTVSYMLFKVNNAGLDINSGAGFGSKSKYMFGKVSIQLKLVEGDSAGTVTAFYVSE